MNLPKRCAIFVLSILSAIGAARGAEVAYQFTGTVDIISGGSLYGVTPALGDIVSGTFTYNTSIPAGPLGSPNLKIYDLPAPYGLTMTLRGVTMASDVGCQVAIDNTFPYDQFVVADDQDGFITANQAVVPGAFRFHAIDGTMSVFSTADLPASLNLSSFDFVFGSITTPFAGGAEVRFIVNSLTPIPEPGTLSLCAGFVAAGVWVRSRRRAIRNQRQMP